MYRKLHHGKALGALIPNYVLTPDLELEAQYAALMAPPVAMLGMACAGAMAGEYSEAHCRRPCPRPNASDSWIQGHPLLFVGFVSFGIVALLALVCNELLIEAPNPIPNPNPNNELLIEAKFSESSLTLDVVTLNFSTRALNYKTSCVA